MGDFRCTYFFAFYLKDLIYWICIELNFDIVEVSSEFDETKEIFGISTQLVFAERVWCTYKNQDFCFEKFKGN